MRIITLLACAALAALLTPSVQAQLGPFEAGDMLGVPPITAPLPWMVNPSAGAESDGGGGFNVDLEFETTDVTDNFIAVSLDGGPPILVSPSLCLSWGEGWYYDEVDSSRDPLYPHYVNLRYALRATLPFPADPSLLGNSFNLTFTGVSVDTSNPSQGLASTDVSLTLNY
jgi:hypothetical protein